MPTDDPNPTVPRAPVPAPGPAAADETVTRAPDDSSADPDRTTARPPEPPAPDGGTVARTPSDVARLEEGARAPADCAVPGYEVLGELGRGGMGVVYRARHVKLNRPVALKMMLGEEVGRSDLIRFLAEAEAVAAVRHENVVEVYDYGEANGRPFMALEFLPGGSLAALFAKGRETVTSTASARDAAKLVTRVARGVAAAHELGIVHRDLKPANVLLDAAGVPKVADFGLAKRGDGSEVTQTGQVMGTPAYMSPEQAKGETKFVGPQADVWALGVMLYEALTGARPFQGSVQEVLAAVQNADPAPPRARVPALPHDLELICLKCLAKPPHERYPTARQLADDLDRFARGEPISVRPAGRLERTYKWVRRNRALAAVYALAAVALAVAAFGGVVAWLWQSAEAARDTAVVQKGEAEFYKAKSDELSALLSLKSGIAACEEGNGGPGTLMIAQSLAICPESAAGVRRRIRTALPTAVAGLHTLEASYPTTPANIVAAYSPDGSKVLVGGSREAYVADAATGARRSEVVRYAREVSGGGFSADGTRFVTATMGGDVRVTDAAGRVVGTPFTHPGTVKSVCFAKDGRSVLVAAQAGTALARYDAATGRATDPAFSACKDNLYAAVFSPDGALIATAAKENNARLWNAAIGAPACAPLPHPGVVFAVAFSPDGKTLATGCLDGGLRFWEVPSGRPTGPVLRHKGAVRSAEFTRDGRLLATASEDGTVRVWEAATGRPVGQVLSHPSEMRTATFSPDQTRLLTAGFEGTVRVWRLAREDALAKTLPHPAPVAAAVFSADGRRVLTGCQESAGRTGESRLWDGDTGTPLGPPMPQNGQVLAVALSPDGRFALTGGNDGTARLWRTSDSLPAQPPWAYEPHGKDNVVVVAALAFSRDGKFAAVGGRGTRVQLREVETGREVHSWLAYERKGYWVWTAAFTPDGTRLLTGGGQAGRVWTVPDGKPVGAEMAHDSEARVAVLSPDAEVVATCSHDKTARLWSARDGAPLCPPLVHKGEVRAAAFRPDGKVLATAAADGTARLWEVPSGRSLGAPLLHDGWVRSVAFSPDGATLATACDDGTARLWDAADGSPGATLRHRGPVTAVAFRPDGRAVLTASADGTARLWFPPQPVTAGPREAMLWAQVLTGMELDAEGTVRVLPADAWQERRAELARTGAALP